MRCPLSRFFSSLFNSSFANHRHGVSPDYQDLISSLSFPPVLLILFCDCISSYICLSGILNFCHLYPSEYVISRFACPYVLVVASEYIYVSQSERHGPLSSIFWSIDERHTSDLMFHHNHALLLSKFRKRRNGFEPFITPPLFPSSLTV